MSWRHPAVRITAGLVTLATIALMFFPDRLGLPLLKLPLLAQLLLGLVVVIAPAIELLARFLPRE